MNYMPKSYFKITDTFKSFFLISVFCISIQSCDSIIADNISDEEVEVLAPLDNTIFQEGSVTFKWESIENAEQYRIQIVEPTFAATNSFVIDSLVTSNEMSFDLTPKNYQWRVRAENNVFETEYSVPVSFLVEGNEDLTSTSVVLSEPVDNIYVNSLQFNFVWENLDEATSYIFQLLKGDENSTDVVEQTNVTNNFYLSPLQSLDESQYTWQIRALNSTSNTEFTFRTLYFDQTAPNTATSLSPGDGDTATTSVDFSWTLGTDPGTVNSPLTTTLEIGSDDAFTNIIHTEDTSLEQLSYTFTSTGTFYWRVVANDEAGNNGSYSAVHEITIQ